MDISAAIRELKKDPRFTENVGMVVAHNGVVRAWSRKDKAGVTAVEIFPDRDKIETIRREIEARPGIWRVLVEANEGRFQPGDDLLFLVVAGDVRENVLPALSDLLNRVKAEAVGKKEIMLA